MSRNQLSKFSETQGSLPFLPALSAFLPRLPLLTASREGNRWRSQASRNKMSSPHFTGKKMTPTVMRASFLLPSLLLFPPADTTAMCMIAPLKRATAGLGQLLGSDARNAEAPKPSAGPLPGRSYAWDSRVCVSADLLHGLGILATHRVLGTGRTTSPGSLQLVWSQGKLANGEGSLP